MQQILWTQCGSIYVEDDNDDDGTEYSGSVAAYVEMGLRATRSLPSIRLLTCWRFRGEKRETFKMTLSNIVQLED